MNTTFTIWHYLNFLLIAGVLIWSIRYILKQKDLLKKGSYIATYCIIGFAFLVISTMVIDQYTKKVILQNVQNHRFLSTESIIFTGTVRNIGNYDVNEVEIEIEIFDKGSKKQGRSSYESTAFRDVYGRSATGDQPKSMTFRKTIAKELKAGHSKQFVVSIRHPSYFHGYSDKERVIVH
ncbi:MAG: DUF2393 family protein [Sulfuricurvum sp.]